MYNDDEQEEKHESYGLIGFYRTTYGGGRGPNLFGSSITSNNVITMRVKRASRKRSLSNFWIHGREELIEVILSPNQFADLVTSMNVGDGVPCTIKYVDGKRMEEPPTVEQRLLFEKEFEKHVRDISGDAKQIIADITKTFDEKASIGKKDREEILKKLGMLMQNVVSNLPFIQGQFNEAMDKTVTEAKAEVEAFVNSKIMSLGIAALEGEVKKALEGTTNSPSLQIESKVIDQPK